MMHVGLCLLRASSRHVWRLSPREFMGLAGAFAHGRWGWTRAALTALMAAFPDQPVHSQQGEP